MKLIKPHYSIWIQKPGLDGIYKQIERAGRVCYKSEKNITEDSAKPFVDRLIKSGHLAMLEHGTVYLKVPIGEYQMLPPEITEKPWNRSTLCLSDSTAVFFTTNYRFIIEHNLEDWLKYICEPTEHHDKRITVHFTCDRGVWNEFIRHRTLQRTDDNEVYPIVDYDAEQRFSFAQESTRFCNYSKDKFNNELTFIIPSWLGLAPGTYKYSYPEGFTLNGTKWPSTLEYNNFLASLLKSEGSYLELIELGWKPQQARQVLPNALKTELVMTGYVSDWYYFFELRTSTLAKTGQPHPSASELANPLYKEFVERGYLQ